MKIKEPGVAREIRAVRNRMAKGVERDGIFAFYSSLNGRAAKLMARHRSIPSKIRPGSAATRKAKRKALVDALPESSVILEVRRIRQKLSAERKCVGRDKLRLEINRLGKEIARGNGLRYMAAPSRGYVLDDQPAKK